MGTNGYVRCALVWNKRVLLYITRCENQTVSSIQKIFLPLRFSLTTSPAFLKLRIGLVISPIADVRKPFQNCFDGYLTCYETLKRLCLIHTRWLFLIGRHLAVIAIIPNVNNNNQTLLDKVYNKARKLICFKQMR